MSAKADKMLCCVSCGIAGGDNDVKKLKDCSACKLVKYCGVQCQREHRREHKKECNRRAAELRDEILFKQQESADLGDCPLCCLPFPIKEKSTMMPCCCKKICKGCIYANFKREIEGRLEHKCPFCRSVHSVQEAKRKFIERAEANDPFALSKMGEEHYSEGDYHSAIQYFTKAVAFANEVGAHHQLSLMYVRGHGVEKDEKKTVYHLEEAAIGGHPVARHNLGHMEEIRGRMDRAVKHFIIAANMGYDSSLEALKKLYRDGLVSKMDLASALRAHQAAVDATKSPLREEAAMFMRSMKK